MPTIDLTTPPPPSAGLLEALPRRVSLTLPELRLVAERAGGAPLPFDTVAPAGEHALEGRLGQSRASAEQAAYAEALAALHDPALSLERRGLLSIAGVNEGLVGAIGLLATPTTALDIDVTVGDHRARAWHRRAGEAVATLSTSDGVVFEVAWLHAENWAGELARAGVLPDDLELAPSAVPDHVDLPFELADAAAEAVASGRTDLLPVLTAQHAGAVVDADGIELAERSLPEVLAALSTETRGRLRVLAANVSGTTSAVGVVSWALLADGWHALRPRYGEDGHHRVEVRLVQPSDLATELAPVLAEVTA